MRVDVFEKKFNLSIYLCTQRQNSHYIRMKLKSDEASAGFVPDSQPGLPRCHWGLSPSLLHDAPYWLHRCSQPTHI